MHWIEKMEDRLNAIIEKGWDFSLKGIGGKFELTLCRPEWVTSDLAQSVILPTFFGNSIGDVVYSAYMYVKYGR